MERVASEPQGVLHACARWLRPRARVLVFTASVLVAILAFHGPRSGIEATPSASLAVALRAQGLKLAPGEFEYITAPKVLGGRGVLFLARPLETRDAGGLYDLYFAEAWGTRTGAVLDLFRVTNLTRSPSADEEGLVREGRFALYRSRVFGRVDAVTVLDLRGEPEALTQGWPRRAKVQNAVTNLLNTGRTSGFGRCRYTIQSPASFEGLKLISPGRAELQLNRERVGLDLANCALTDSHERLAARPSTKGMPGTITWVVDTVRGLSFVGPEPIEWLEHRVFSVQDQVARWTAWLRESSNAEQEERVREELGVAHSSERRRFELAHADPEQGFPPAPMRPVFSSPLSGEGEWMPVVEDPFAKTYPNAPVPFYTSYIRPDRERSFARVYVVMWDPRLVQLRMMAGTREPEGATGETGPGQFSRDEKTLERVVGGFNGGFQALHGEFGMMVDKTVYLPPKPWAATVAVFQDGRVAMGSWTDPPEGRRAYREEWALEQIPSDMVDFRQNLTSVVEGDRYNPWGRWWWGAAPLNADEQLHIDRSGLCLTEEGHLAYFWGRSLGPEALGEAMLRARCSRGMHLDMNVRHTGFEFLNVQEDGAHPVLPPDALGRGRFDGPMPHAPGYRLRARLLVRSMKPMRFPRYASRDPRDFFYLTLKPVLPGPDLTLGDGEHVRFSTTGLPHAGFPRPFARVFRGANPDAGTWLVRIDLNRISFEAPKPEVDPPTGDTSSPPRPLAYLTEAIDLRRAQGCGFGLFMRLRKVGVERFVGTGAGEGELLLCGPPLSGSAAAGAALGVDPEGFLLYAERTGEDTETLQQRLEEAGVREAIALPAGVRLAFPTDEAFVGPGAFERTVSREASMALWSSGASATSVLFPDTAPRVYSRWARMQDTRVRYIREGTPTFSRSSGGLRDEDDESEPN